MARARKSHVSDEENTKSKRRSGIEPAYSPRVDGHRYVLYCTWHKEDEKYPRTIVMKFLGTYAAKWFLTKLIGKDEFEWDKWVDQDHMIVTSSGIKIRAANDQVRKIHEYEPTEEEAAWRDEQLIGTINRFRYGTGEGDISGSTLSASDIENEDPVAGDRLRKSRTKSSKPVREKKPKVDKSGFVSANDIARELGVEGREVRGVLRSLGLKKPDVGWAWPSGSDDLKKAHKAIQDGLKELAKKKGKKK